MNQPTPPLAAHVDLDVVEGLRCAGCVRRLEQALDGAPGVTRVQVDLLARRVHLEVVPGTDAAGLVGRLTTAGFDARIRTALAPPAADHGPDDRERQAAWSAALIAISTMALAMAFHHQAWAAWSQAGLATLALVWPGRPLLWRAMRNAIRLAPDMDVLVALGALAAYAYAITALALGHDHLHFESAAAIIAFTLVGRALEARARSATGAAVAALLARTPPEAALIRSDGAEMAVPVASLRPGDRVRVRPGGAIPVDGLVVEGGSEIDESWFTGEPLPVARQTGDRVRAGTNARLGTLVVQVERAGTDTALARTAAALGAAQAAKPPVARLADRVAAVFVPAVLVLSGLTWLAWWLAGAPGRGALAAADVLVIACPCALGLATPAAVAVAVGRAAALGVLVRDGAALEALAGCTRVALDKTGTCTTGRPQLTEVLPAPDCDRDTLLRLAAAVETGSEHPLAAAVRSAATGLEIPPASDFSAEPGGGVRAVVDGGEVLAGTAAWLAGRGISVHAGTGTEIHVAANGRCIGSMRFTDTVREDAATGIARLRALGLTPSLLTGDRAGEAQRVGSLLGIAEIHADLPPEGKSAAVQELRHAGQRVLAVGDGINDAAMLTAADAGAAVGGGADVAVLAGGLVLDARQPLAAAAAAVALSRAAMRTIRQNLAGAAIYNLFAIPVAAAGIIDPMWASAAMAASSLTVLANSLRLRRFRPPA